MRDGRIIQNTLSDAFGRFIVHNLAAGSYTVSVHFIGFKPFNGTVTMASADVRLNVQLTVASTQLQAIQVTAEAPVAVDTRTGDQVFTEQESHVAPTTTTSQIVQQSVAGAARAPTGEVHIRGQHAEYSYYIDGIPVTAGVSGSLNELFDPAIINRLDFQTGGWDAEYGEKNAAIINVATRIPTGAFHMNASAAGGSFGASSQSLNVSGNSGKWGFFVSGSRSVTDMRLEPVMFDTTTYKAYNFHNHGEDDFAFAKIQYQSGSSDIVTLDMDWGRTNFQVPYDTSGGATADDHQTDINGFANLGWRHRFGGPSSALESSASELFVGAFYRHGSLDFIPGSNDTPSFTFAPDTTPYNLLEHRFFDTYGVKADFSYKPTHEFEWKSGVMASQTTGHETFVTTSASGAAGPASNSGLAGGDFSVYSEINWSLSETVELRTGVRYDTHAAPFAGTTSQLSPRIRLNFYPDNSNTLFLYFGRLFVPTNVEDLRNITAVADSGVATSPTYPGALVVLRGRLVPAPVRRWCRDQARRVPQRKLAGPRRHDCPRLCDRYRREPAACQQHRCRVRHGVSSRRAADGLSQRRARPRMRTRPARCPAGSSPSTPPAMATISTSTMTSACPSSRAPRTRPAASTSPARRFTAAD